MILSLSSSPYWVSLYGAIATSYVVQIKNSLEHSMIPSVGSSDTATVMWASVL